MDEQNDTIFVCEICGIASHTKGAKCACDSERGCAEPRKPATQYSRFSGRNWYFTIRAGIDDVRGKPVAAATSWDNDRALEQCEGVLHEQASRQGYAIVNEWNLWD